MRKLLGTAVTVLAVVAAACGGSPTAPQPSQVHTNASAAGVGNAPAPTPPTADPTSPTPGPAPAPPPAPTPLPPPAPTPDPTVETWHATVEVQRASSPENALPATFTVTIRGTQMSFGPLEVTILAREGTHIYARKGTDVTIEIDDGKWTVTSVPVFATGTISYSAP